GALRLDTRQRLVLVEGAAHAHYISSGHLVFTRGGQILAVPFDTATLQVKGVPVPVIDGVLYNLAQGAAQFAPAGEGSIAYIPGSETQDNRTLVWVDRGGAVQSVGAPKRNYEYPRLSPDGQQIGVRMYGAPDSGTDIRLYHFECRRLSRVA